MRNINIYIIVIMIVIIIKNIFTPVVEGNTQLMKKLFGDRKKETKVPSTTKDVATLPDKLEPRLLSSVYNLKK